MCEVNLGLFRIEYKRSAGGGESAAAVAEVGTNFRRGDLSIGFYGLNRPCHLRIVPIGASLFIPVAYAEGGEACFSLCITTVTKNFETLGNNLRGDTPCSYRKGASFLDGNL